MLMSLLLNFFFFFSLKGPKMAPEPFLKSDFFFLWLRGADLKKKRKSKHKPTIKERCQRRSFMTYRVVKYTSSEKGSHVQ